MGDAVQHIVVTLVAAAAAWAAWRNLRGLPWLRRARRDTPPDGCSRCGSASDHHRH